MAVDDRHRHPAEHRRRQFDIEGSHLATGDGPLEHLP
jgi:hypothetical protein